MIVLFTGINGELGKSFARNFGQKHTIVGVGRHEKCQAENVSHYIQKDLLEKPADVVWETLDTYSRIDAIVNSAVFYTFQESGEVSSENLQQSLILNVIVPQAINQAFTKIHRNHPVPQGGWIVNLSSYSGKHTYPHSLSYSVSKAALDMAGRYEAGDYKKFNIKVNSVCPTTFPKLVATEIVASEVEKLLHTEQTGKTTYVDSNRIWTE